MSANNVAARHRRRSIAVPLSIVPTLAATIAAGACSSQPAQPDDPCDRTTYTQVECERAVANRGYWYGGAWYPHVYPYNALYYAGLHSSYLATGGRVRRVSPTIYAPGSRGAVSGARPNVTRGGFGGIGSGRFTAGS